MSGRIAYVDERRILEAEFKDLDNLHVNVAEGIVVYITKPNEDVIGPFSATRYAKGVYRYDYYPPVEGKYRYRFQNPDGTIKSDKTFSVKKPEFDALPPFLPTIGVTTAPSITYTVNSPFELDATTLIATVTYVANTPEVGPIVGISSAPSTTYEAQDPEGVLQIQHGDIFFIQEGTVVDATLDARSIGHQKRQSYPNGDWDGDEINLIYDYSSEPWTPHYIAVDSKNFKIVFAAQHDTNTEEWYVYTMNFDGTGLTKIYDAPIDLSNEYFIGGISINNRDDAPTNEKLWVSIDGTYALIFRGYLISMAIDGTNQVTQAGPARNAGPIWSSDRDNKLIWDRDDGGVDNHTMDPFAYTCDSHALTLPLNSRSGGYNGEDNKWYNVDAFGTIRITDVSCSPVTTFSVWIASHPTSSFWLEYSDYSDEVIAGGGPGKTYDRTTPGSGREVNRNSTQATSNDTLYIAVFEPEFVT